MQCTLDMLFRSPDMLFRSYAARGCPGTSSMLFTSGLEKGV
jgi:hypothetical protein